MSFLTTRGVFIRKYNHASQPSLHNARRRTQVVIDTVLNGQLFLDAQARCASRNQRELALVCASSLLDVGAVRRGCSVNPAIRLIRIVRNELDGNG